MDTRVVFHDFDSANGLHAVLERFLVLEQIIDVLVDLLSSLLLLAVDLQSVALRVIGVDCLVHLVVLLQGLDLTGVVGGLGAKLLLGAFDSSVERGLDMWR